MLKGKMKKQNVSPISEFSGCSFGIWSIDLTFGDLLVNHHTFLAIYWSNKIRRWGILFGWLVVVFCCGILFWGFVVYFVVVVVVGGLSAQEFPHISISFFEKSRSPHWRSSDFNWTFPVCAESCFQTPSWYVFQWESWFWQLKSAPS